MTDRASNMREIRILKSPLLCLVLTILLFAQVLGYGHNHASTIWSDLARVGITNHRIWMKTPAVIFILFLQKEICYFYMC